MKTVLLDSNSLINRAYYAMKNPLSDKNGQPTGAVYGYVNMLLKIIDEVKPTHIVAAFDVHAPTFRKEKCDYYKAQRKPMPEDLVAQVPMLHDLLRAMNITICEMAGYEADDVLGTLSRTLKGDKIIVTGDRDCLQLVSKDTTVWLTKKGITEVVKYTPERLAEDGLEPYQIIELKSLMGDASDNIKGVPGVGEKTAFDLIAKYKSLQGVYDHIDELKGKLRENLENNVEIAKESRWLATINVNAPVTVDEEAAAFHTPFPASAQEKLLDLNFKSIVSRLEFETAKSDKEFATVTVNDVNLAKNAEKLSVFLGEDVHFSVDGKTDYVVGTKTSLLDEGMDYDVAVKSLFESGAKKIVIHDRKTAWRKYGFFDTPAFDTYLAEYLIAGGENYEDAQKLFLNYGFDGKAAAAQLFCVAGEQEKLLEEKGLADLCYNVEFPLSKVLFDMEKTGVKVDKSAITAARESYAVEIAQTLEKIYELAGEQFNVNSTKQLATVLFEKLGLHATKKTKTGYSLTAEVLENMEGVHPIISYILRYRKIAKLQSTYVDGLLAEVGSDERVHTEFKQGLTSTGRLSSVEPNLQNIPTRTPEGQLIRKFFVASEGNELVCADYSQIELRLLACFSGDKKLVDAYLSGEDIHRATAAAVNGVSLLEVTDEMRRNAKAVNFGIIYGISDFGLSQNIGTSVQKAKEIITRYFDTYPTVKSYMEKNKEFARENGFVRTFAGRIRYIPEIKASNFNVRSFGERAAMNMPLQGASADIIKMAMIGVASALEKENMRSRLILQIHDELIVDAPEDEVEKVKGILKKEMENAVDFKVKLTVEIGEGKSWYDAK